MRLAHLHLPNPISYAHSLRLQEAVLERNFAYTRTLLETSKTLTTSRTDSAPSPPPPVLLTFQTHPTYTVGRRHLKTNPLSHAQIDFLTSTSTSTRSSERTALPQPANQDVSTLATFYPSPRGGLLTYHAPGQLTAYLIYNLRAYGITPRCHIRVLEKAVIRTCARHGVPNTLVTDDPGVWIGTPAPGHMRNVQQSPLTEARESDEESGDFDSVATVPNNQPCSLSPPSESTSQTQTQTQTQPQPQELIATNRKICAVGVHVSRGITSHGIGLNVHDAPITTSLADLYKLPALTDRPENPLTFQPRESTTPAPGYLSWGFSRIIACGLQGKSVTWLSNEVDRHGLTSTLNHGAPDFNGDSAMSNINTEDLSVSGLENVSHTLAEEICLAMTERGRIVIDGVDPVDGEDYSLS